MRTIAEGCMGARWPVVGRPSRPKGGEGVILILERIPALKGRDGSGAPSEGA
jgi:hypothetical protein